MTTSTRPNPQAAPLIPFLVDYLFWLRDRVLETAAALDDATFLATPRMHGRDLRATLAHEMDVEMSWRGKLQGLPIERWGPAAEIKPERFSTLAELAAAWREEERMTRDWLATLTPADLDAPTTVNGLDGRPLAVYVLHVVEHGVTEFSIASGLLDELGHEVGDLSILRMLDGR
ncbi:MAG TPA: DinB family protein [Candidatus Limnocylindrales bacterium]|nr:DinB family protein [Candidatus Limnocylindrales bacterium]